MEMKPKDEQILTALLSCGNIRDASIAAGVSHTTIYNRLSDKDFKAEYLTDNKDKIEYVESGCVTMNTIYNALIR